MAWETTCCLRYSERCPGAAGGQLRACKNLHSSGCCIEGYPAEAAHASCRAQLASVCRRWLTVSTGTHAAVVWQQLEVDEATLGFPPIIYYGSLFRWCAALGCHIRDLQLPISQLNADDNHPSVRESADRSSSQYSYALQCIHQQCPVLAGYETCEPTHMRLWDATGRSTVRQRLAANTAVRHPLHQWQATAAPERVRPLRWRPAQQRLLAMQDHQPHVDSCHPEEPGTAHS